MRYGIITDIHSNIIALKKVFEQFEKRKVDKIICCGDIIGIGPFPEQCVQELIKRKEILISVMGNHENYLVNGLPKFVHNDKRLMSNDEIENHKWNHSRLSDESKTFINNLEKYKVIEDGGIKIYVIHYPFNTNGEYKKHIKNPSIEECKQLFNDIDSNVILYGHTHTTNIINNNQSWYINVGSLGCPSGSDNANCGLLTINNENIEFEHLCVKYDVKQVKEDIRKINYPESKKMIEIFY